MGVSARGWGDVLKEIPPGNAGLSREPEREKGRRVGGVGGVTVLFRSG